MSPNATDSSTILREERKIPNGCTNGWPSMSDSTEKQCWKGQAFLKINEILGLVKHYSLRAYIIFWRQYIVLYNERKRRTIDILDAHRKPFCR